MYTILDGDSSCWHVGLANEPCAPRSAALFDVEWSALAVSVSVSVSVSFVRLGLAWLGLRSWLAALLACFDRDTMTFM